MSLDYRNLPKQLREITRCLDYFLAFALLEVDEMNKQKINVPIKSLDQIEDTWKKTTTMPIRDKLTALKSLGFDIKNAYKPGVTTPNQMMRFIDLLREIVRIPNRSQSLVLLLNKIYANWLSLTGNANSEIIQKKAKKLHVCSGQIVVADKTLDATLLNEVDDKSELNLINNGSLFVFGTGSDGLVTVQCRVVDASEPVLTLKEYKCCVDSTDIAVIKVSSGVLQIACLGGLNDPQNILEIQVTQGNYKVAAHYFYIEDKFDGFYVVLCKTDIEAKNQLQAISILEAN